MVNILLCGNEKVFDGALTLLISACNKTKEPICCYIFTADVTYKKPEYTCIKDEQIDFLRQVIKQKNSENDVVKIDVTNLYNEEFRRFCK